MSVLRIYNFLTKAGQLSLLKTTLDIFIYDNTMYVFYIIFQLREYPCNITHDISFLIYNGYF